MNDDLTMRIRAAGNNTTLTPPPPDLVRASAERRRRNRRWSGAVLIAVVAVLSGTSVLVRDLRPPQTVPPVAPPVSVSTSPVSPAVLPARTSPVEPLYYELMFVRDENVVVVLESSVPSDRPHVRLEAALESAIPSERGRCPESTGSCRVATPEPGMHDLAADPTLTSDALAYFAELSGYGPHWTALTADLGVPTLTACFPGNTAFGATGAHVAAFISVSGNGPGANFQMTPLTASAPGYLIETVFEFKDPLSAADGYRSIRDQAGNCDRSLLSSTMDGPNNIGPWPVEEVFIGEFGPPN